MELKAVDVKNRLVVSGNDKDIAKFMRTIANPEENRLVDFSQIIPYPEDLYLGPITAEALQTHGQNNWYDFNKRFWGTYYNAYDAERFGNIIDFQTAWRPPIRVIKKMATMFPELTFTFKYAAQKFGGQIGHMTLQGENVTHHRLETQEDVIKLHSALWPVEYKNASGMKP